MNCHDALMVLVFLAVVGVAIERRAIRGRCSPSREET